MRFFCSLAGTETEHTREDGTEQERYLKRPITGVITRSVFLDCRGEGNIYDEYELHEVLGKGGMGQVNLARHKKSGKAYAVKTVAKEKVKDMDALRRELDFLKVLDHPNVVRLYETFEDDEQLYVVMEQCVGDNLSDRINQKFRENTEGFDEAEIMVMAKQMLRALAYCHTHSIVHRDIKPANFICNEESLKLIDFGVSGVVPKDKKESASSPSSSSSTSLRATPSRRSEKFLNVRTGTTGYIAPEILLSRLYGTAADMFSLGCTLFTMVTGKHPKWLQAVGVYHFPDGYKLKRLSEDGRRFLALLLARDPKQRPAAEKALKDPWILKATDVSKEPRTQDLGQNLQKFSKRSKLQQCARAAVAALADLNDANVQELRAGFIAADTEGHGEISSVALAEALHMEERAEARALLASIDQGRTGTISFSEWIAAASPSSFFGSDDEAYEAFKMLDRNGDGHISVADLQEILPHVFSQQQLAEDMQNHDLGSTEQLDFQDFKKVLRRSIDSFDACTTPPSRNGKRGKQK